MLNSGMYSSKTDLWSTPQDFYDELNREFKFVLDACALPCNAFKYLWRCKKKHDTPEEDVEKAVWYLQKYLELGGKS